MELNVVGFRLCADKRNWDELLSVLKPKLFSVNETRKLIDPRILAKVAETLTNVDLHVPDRVVIVLLKCLINSCVDGYLHKKYDATGSDEELYSRLAGSNLESIDGKATDKCDYPLLTHFPYDGIAEWTVNNILERTVNGTDSSDDRLEILIASIKFLCNLATFACKTVVTPEYENIPVHMENKDFKDAITKLTRHEHILVANSACAYVHNTLTLLPESYYTIDAKRQLSLTLITSIRAGITSASDASMFLLKREDRLRAAYKDIPADVRLRLLDAFRREARESVYDEVAKNAVVDFSSDAIEFLSECFSKKSDLILKTASSYSDETEPIEIAILLDILGVLTCASSKGHCILRDDEGLLINCIYLLKSLQVAGKEPNNYFTPVQKLSEIAPGARKVSTNGDAALLVPSERKEWALDERKGDVDVQSHPAFGFKAGLIRVIGNLVYRHEGNQDLLRETEGIPLLLDCCNIDARNPLIAQWTILAMRNACENNTRNQDVVRSLTKIGIVDSAVLGEMGLTLQRERDGRSVGIVPIDRT